MSITLSHGLRMVAIGRYAHFCPACEEPHVFNVSADDHPRGLKWDFNGDFQKPTFSPAMEVEHVDPARPTRCRYYLTNGQLEFLGDCSHEFRNRTVPLPVFPRSHP